MKADKVRQFMLKKYPTSEYFDCPVPKHHWEVIQEYAEHYARIQIEKDREDCSENVPINKLWSDDRKAVKDFIKNRPINLE